jgi:hypothetical protein
MSQAQSYTYTDLSQPGALTLEIEGTVYEVTQFASSWALNTIPTAVCALAVGRNMRSGRAATIHRVSRYRYMTPAKVWFRPRGDISLTQKWPEAPQVIFDGYFNGFGYRKINGKVNAVASLTHWLSALAFSSAITKNGHVANPTQMNTAAILQAATGLGGIPDRGAYLTNTQSYALVSSLVGTDLWLAIKTNFCQLANTAMRPGGGLDTCLGGGDATVNTPALKALARIEGPTSDTACDLAYQWGVPLALGSAAFASVVSSISLALTTESLESYAGTSFWDKLIGRYCPQFGMAVVPMINTAIVIADTPLLSADPFRDPFPFWKEIDLIDYDSLDDGFEELYRPLRGIGVIAGYSSQTLSGIEGPTSPFIIGGCYAEDSVDPGDGLYQYIPGPPWLEGQFASDFTRAGVTTGLTNNGAQPTSTTPAINAAPPQNTFRDNARELYDRYAHMVYASHVLRNRSKVISGKLRFDIAPGALLRINPSPELFLGSEDGLATIEYAVVSRVTVSINAEGSVAGTTFNLTHCRTEKENNEPRTSLREHPLFGTSIHGGGSHGSPLIDVYNL